MAVDIVWIPFQIDASQTVRAVQALKDLGAQATTTQRHPRAAPGTPGDAARRGQWRQAGLCAG